MRLRWRLLTPFLACWAACAEPGEGAIGPDGGSLLDGVRPTLTVTAPERGFVARGAGSIEVRGRVADEGSGIDKVTVNGNLVTVGADGSFTAAVKLVPGVNLIQTRVVDAEHNERSETRAVLAGNLVSVDTPVAEGITFRLDRDAVRVAAEVGAKALGTLDLQGLLMAENPIFDDGITCLSARVDVSRARKGAIHFSVVPVDGGLEVDASVSDLDLGLHVAYNLGCKDKQVDLTFTASRYRLEGHVGVALASDGNITLDMSETTAAFDGFDWGGDVLPAGVQDFVEQPLAEVVATLVADELEAELRVQIADRLRGQDQPLDIEGEQVVIALRPTALRVDRNGILATMETRVRAVAPAGTMFPSSPAARPALDKQPRPLGIGLSDDALNQLLASLWGGGALARSLVVPDDALAELGLGFNHATFELRLAPTVEALPDGAGLRVTLGDVIGTFEQREAGKPARPAGSAAISLRGVFSARLVDNHVAISATAPELFIDVLDREGSGELDEDTLRTLAKLFSGTLAGVVNNALAGVPLPAVEGMRVVDGAVTTGDTAGGYLVVRGNVTLP